jgi:hypothetical protein
MRIYKKKCIQRHFPKERKMERKIKMKLIGEAVVVALYTRSGGGGSAPEDGGGVGG